MSCYGIQEPNKGSQGYPIWEPISPYLKRTSQLVHAAQTMGSMK